MQIQNLFETVTLTSFDEKKANIKIKILRENKRCVSFYKLSYHLSADSRPHNSKSKRSCLNFDMLQIKDFSFQIKTIFLK